MANTYKSNGFAKLAIDLRVSDCFRDGGFELDSATLISNDKAVTDFNTSWIEEKSIKEIMESPFTTNITNEIYKVNTFIKKAPGNGFGDTGHH